MSFFFFFFFAVLLLSPDETPKGGPRGRLGAAIFSSSFAVLVVVVLPRGPFSGRRRRSKGKRGREREREKDVTIFKGRIFFPNIIIPLTGQLLYCNICIFLHL